MDRKLNGSHTAPEIANFCCALTTGFCSNAQSVSDFGLRRGSVIQSHATERGSRNFGVGDPEKRGTKHDLTGRYAAASTQQAAKTHD
mmetsp:Transcript_9968/g.42093  ORF Transcript_9968/g.42093 Transcript_9968/m.42093 type:complete len:87 (-) Transcript_9968:846-1106(-)